MKYNFCEDWFLGAFPFFVCGRFSCSGSLRLKIAFTIEDVIGTLGDLPGIIGFRCHIPSFVAPRHFEVLVASLNELFWTVFSKGP